MCCKLCHKWKGPDDPTESTKPTQPNKPNKQVEFNSNPGVTQYNLNTR